MSPSSANAASRTRNRALGAVLPTSDRVGVYTTATRFVTPAPSFVLDRFAEFRRHRNHCPTVRADGPDHALLSLRDRDVDRVLAIRTENRQHFFAVGFHGPSTPDDGQLVPINSSRPG